MLSDVNDRGFTLVELIVSLVLAAIVASAVGSVFIAGTRAYTRQMERAQVNSNLRVAMSILTRELRLLDAGDENGSDLIEMARGSITYRAVRSTYFLCKVPDPSRSEVTAWRSPFLGLRNIEAGRDSVLVLATNDATTGADDVWLPAAVTSVSTSVSCPGDMPGITIGLSGLAESDLLGVGRGSAVLGYQVTRVLLYEDSRAEWWVGIREWRSGSGWSVTQPVVGPVAPNGLRFDYYGSDAGAALTPSAVSRIGITVVGVSGRPVGRRGGSAVHVSDSVAVQVALRNNPRRG